MISPRWKKVIRDLLEHKTRTMLSVLSIAIGVIAFGGMLITGQTVLRNLDLAYNESNPADITLDLTPFDHELLRWVKAQPGVQDVAGLSVLYGTLIKNDGKEQDITLYAHDDYNAIDLNRIKLIAGKFPQQRGEIAVERGSTSGAGLAPGAGVSLRAGDTVRIKLNSDEMFNLRYTGKLYDVSVPGGPAATRLNFYVSERTLSDLHLPAQPTRLIIRTTPGTTVAQKYALADRLRDRINLRGLTVRSINVNERGEHWATSIINGVLVIIVMVGAVALVMSGLLIINVVNGLLISQKKIIGIMKIIGADRWQIFGVYLAMMASLGVMALLIAMPLSGMLGQGIAGLVTGMLNYDLDVSGFTPAIAAVEVFVALLVPVAFSVLPIWSALQETAAEAISEVTPRQHASPIEKLLARLGSLPRTMVLAIRSLFRNHLRLVATLLTLVAAGGIFTSIMNLRIGMPATMTVNTGSNLADVTVSFGTPVNRIGAINRALQVTGVVAAEGWIATPATVVRDTSEGSTLTLNGSAANSRFVKPPLLEGSRWLSPYSRETRDELVVTQGILEFEPNLRVGDFIKLKHGDETHTFRIVGFMNGLGSQAFGHYETVSRLAGAPAMASSVRVATEDTSAAYTNALTGRLRKVFEDVKITVVSSQSRATLLNNVLSAFDILFILMILVSVLIAIVGGLGLAGTMSLSVMERTREVGVMRAVGAESPDLRFMFVFEGLCIGLMSAVAAFALSVPLSSLLGEVLGTATRQGVFMPQVNVMGYVLWLVIVSVVSIVASLSPARRATHISIREALAYA